MVFEPLKFNCILIPSSAVNWEFYSMLILGKRYKPLYVSIKFKIAKNEDWICTAMMVDQGKVIS